MEDKVKLVIEIPKYYLEHPQDYTCLVECVRRGTPLDDVKEKIAKLRLIGYADALGKYETASKAVMDVLDNIGKGE